MVIHITLGAVAATNSLYWTAPATHPAIGQEVIRYVNGVAKRLITKIRFTVNGNPLDEINSDIYNFHDKFYVTPNKRVGWNRLIGQENPKPGFADVNQGGAANLHFRGAGVRQALSFLDGPQTFKAAQPALDLWLPLLFWFNRD